MSQASSNKRIIVAHDAAPIREAALRVVREAGYEALGVGDGESVRLLLDVSPRPAALVVDVGLPGLHGYELVDEVRRRALPVRVVFIASVYSRTAYIRQPTRLYGADDYFEQHHIVDKLAPKLVALLADRAEGASATRRDVHAWDDLSAQERKDFENIRAAGEGRLVFASEGIARAREIARLIVADLALYTGEVWGEGLSVGDLERRLARDLDTARELFLLRVPVEIAQTQDFVLVALREFLAGRAQREQG